MIISLLILIFIIDNLFLPSNQKSETLSPKIVSTINESQIILSPIHFGAQLTFASGDMFINISELNEQLKVISPE